MADRDQLNIPDASVTAAQFNWLIMAAPLNEAMLPGDETILNEEELRRQAAEDVRVFRAAYAKPSTPNVAAELRFRFAWS